MYDHTFYKQVLISRSDIRPHIKWAVSLVILHMITSIFLRALCGYKPKSLPVLLCHMFLLQPIYQAQISGACVTMFHVPLADHLPSPSVCVTMFHVPLADHLPSPRVFLCYYIHCSYYSPSTKPKGLVPVLLCSMFLLQTIYQAQGPACAGRTNSAVPRRS